MKKAYSCQFLFYYSEWKGSSNGWEGELCACSYKNTETYDNLRDSIAGLRMEMSDWKEISANNCTYKVEYFIAGDWKLLALVCGLGRVNEDYACVWCKCPRSEQWDTSKHWSIKNPPFGCRTIIEIETYSWTKKFNSKAKPFFDFTPIDHVIIATLHLFLRISDVLIDLLIRELKRGDSIEEKKFWCIPQKQINTWPLMKSFSKTLVYHLIFELTKTVKKLEYSDLTDPEKLKLFQNINTCSLLLGCINIKISNTSGKNLWISLEIWSGISHQRKIFLISKARSSPGFANSLKFIKQKMSLPVCMHCTFMFLNSCHYIKIFPTIHSRVWKNTTTGPLRITLDQQTTKD